MSKSLKEIIEARDTAQKNVSNAYSEFEKAMFEMKKGLLSRFQFLKDMDDDKHNYHIHLSEYNGTLQLSIDFFTVMGVGLNNEELKEFYKFLEEIKPTDISFSKTEHVNDLIITFTFPVK